MIAQSATVSVEMITHDYPGEGTAEEPYQVTFVSEELRATG